MQLLNNFLDCKRTIQQLQKIIWRGPWSRHKGKDPKYYLTMPIVLQNIHYVYVSTLISIKKRTKTSTLGIV